MNSLPRQTLLFSLGSCVLIAGGLAGWQPPDTLQLAMLAALVVLVGLPHGALDPLVARHAGLATGHAGMIRFLLRYSVQALVTVMAWWLAPGLTLACFLTASVFHFADDWAHRLSPWHCLLGGATVVLAPILFHPNEVLSVFSVLAGEKSANFLVSALQLPAALSVAALIIVNVLDLSRRRWVAVEIGMILVLAWLFPPLVFFVVYFCGLHSPRHLAQNVRDLPYSTRKMLAVAGAITLLTLAAGSLVLINAPAWTLSDSVLRIVFIGLAALTVPHMLLLSKVKSVGSREPQIFRQRSNTGV